jgi:hypothetical protein
MSWFDFLKRVKKTASLPPIRTVQEPGAARRERDEQVVEEVASTSRVDPTVDFFDTGSLEMARETTDGDNPYDTQTWATTPGGLRRVDDLSAVNKKRKSGSEENPYDTKIKRKGW